LQREDDVTRFHQVLKERGSSFGLEVSPEKIKVIEFGVICEIESKKIPGDHKRTNAALFITENKPVAPRTKQRNLQEILPPTKIRQQCRTMKIN